MMKRTIIIISFSLLSLIFFMLLTFPVERLGPRIASVVENGLDQSLGGRFECVLDDLALSFPVGLRSPLFSCRSGQEALFSFRDLSIGLLPTSITIRAGVGQGRMSIELKKDLFNMSPKRIVLNFEQTPLANLMPAVFQFARSLSPAVISLELQGALAGSASFPLQDFAKESGMMDLQIQNLKLPQQAPLELIGFTELNFSTAQAKATLENGTLSLETIALIAPEIAGKASGSLQIDETSLMDSVCDLSLKWKIQKSDALLNSLLGPQLLNSDCPSIDSEGFCTRRVNRLSELSTLFSSPRRSRFQ